VSFFKAPKSIVETNLIEERIRPLRFNGSTIDLTFGQYEIKTLKVIF